MNRLERINDPEAALLVVLRGWQAGVYTAMPAIIDSFDPVKETCEAYITIQAKVTDKDGVAHWVSLPKLVDVPVCFPGGGGYTLTFPVAKGDEALIIFSSRCIDNWWLVGGVQTQADLRMHDLSDGFAFVGVKSQPNILSPAVSANSAQLRSNDGNTYVEVAAGTIKLKAPTSVTIDTPLTTITGDLVVNGAGTIKKLFSYLAGLSGIGGTAGSSITGAITHDGKNISSTHTHSDPQGGTTGPVT